MTKKKDQVLDKEEQSLTPEELRKLEHSFIHTQLKQKDFDKHSVMVQKANTELTLLSAQYTLKSREIADLKQQGKNLEKELQEFKELQKEIRKEIQEKYGLKENWGFDPETGVIK